LHLIFKYSFKKTCFFASTIIYLSKKKDQAFQEEYEVKKKNVVSLDTLPRLLENGIQAWPWNLFWINYGRGILFRLMIFVKISHSSFQKFKLL